MVSRQMEHYLKGEMFVSIRKSEAHRRIIIKALSQVALFKNLTVDDLEKLCDMAGIAQYGKGTWIIRQGEIGDRVYILASGKLKICKKSLETEIVLKVAGPGEVIGEMALLDNLPRSANVMVEEDALLFYITKEDFLCFVQTNPGMAMNFLEKMSLKIREQNEKIVFFEALAVNTLNDDLVRKESNTKEAEGLINTPAHDGVGESSDNKDDDYYFIKKYTCPLCQQGITSLAVRPKYIEAENIDNDMCIQYGLVNPNFYKVIVCVHCKFAFTEESPKNFSAQRKEMIKKGLSNVYLDKDYSGIRSIDDAITTHELAINCLTLAGAKYSILGNLNLNLCCIYKQKGDFKREKLKLEQALLNFKRAFTNEFLHSLSNELYVLYIIGEIYRRLNMFSNAQKWFRYIIDHPKGRSNPYLFKKAESRWLEVSEQNGT